MYYSVLDLLIKIILFDVLIYLFVNKLMIKLFLF